MTISDLVREAHLMAVDKGFHDEPMSTDRALLLIVSEIIEGHDEVRNGRLATEVYKSKGGKPEGLPIELADAVIRIADFCGLHDIDLERAIWQKMQYNAKRPFKHGKEF